MARTHSSNEQLYFAEDTHWNVKGNHLAAEATYDYLLTNQLLGIESGR